MTNNPINHGAPSVKRHKVDTPAALSEFIAISSDSKGDGGGEDDGTGDWEFDDEDESENDDPSYDNSEPPLCEEQQRVVDLAVTGCNIFYTGSAGCGKTRVLQAIKAALKAQSKEVQVMPRLARPLSPSKVLLCGPTPGCVPRIIRRTGGPSWLRRWQHVGPKAFPPDRHHHHRRDQYGRELTPRAY